LAAALQLRVPPRPLRDAVILSVAAAKWSVSVSLDRGTELGQSFRRFTFMKINDFRLIALIAFTVMISIPALATDKPGSKNAKEVRVDAATGKIFNVQTEKPEDQAEEPAKTH
jgi:hypothetical protein